jgi:hypothetical protein
MAVHESWWPRCRVSHPPERKVCLHCGGRTQPHRDGAQVFDAQSALESRLRQQAPSERSPFEPAPAPVPGPVDAADEEAEPESRTARGARLGLTLVWIALAIGASLLRMCQEPG